MSDFYNKFINAKGVAVAWIGALIGPTFFWVGLTESRIGLSGAGIVLLVVTMITMACGISAVRAGGSHSDTIVFLVVPTILLAGGVAFAYSLSS